MLLQIQSRATKKLAIRLFSHRLLSTSFLAGKRCLITGGSRGIGQAIAFKLAAEGASCILLSRTLSMALSAASLLDTSLGQEHEAVQLDVASTRRVWDANDLGGTDPASIDIVVNAAGIFFLFLLLL